MDSSHAARLDGRKLRAERSRAAVAMAALELIRDGYLKPTASDIAYRADVSLRSFFHYFDDMESLYRAVFRLQHERLRPLLAKAPSPDEPIGKRVDGFVRQRSIYLEEMAQVFRAVELVAPTAPSLFEHLQASRAVLRNQVASLFEADLAVFPASERRERLHAMQVGTGFAAWEALRTEMDLGVSECTAVMRRTLVSQLGLAR